MATLTVNVEVFLTWCDIFCDAFIQIELCTQLIKVCYLQSSAVSDAAALRFKLAKQHVQQRGFAAAVGSDDADFIAASNQQRELANLWLSFAVSEVEIFGFDDHIAGAFGFLYAQLRSALGSASSLQIRECVSYLLAQAPIGEVPAGATPVSTR